MPTLRAGVRFIGQNSQGDASELQPGEAADCLNVNLDKGTIKKRDGYAQELNLSAGGDIQGVFDWEKSDGTLMQLIKAGQKLYKITYDAGSGAKTAAELGTNALVADGLATFMARRDRAYVCDGTNFKVTDGTNIYTAHITRPGATTTAVATAAAGSSLDGEYEYKITFYAPTWGQESLASEPTAAVTATGTGVRLDVIPTSSDARVTQRRVYRRNIAQGEVTYHYVDTIEDDTSTTYHDDISNFDTSTTEIAPVSVDFTDTDFAFMINHQDVTFLVKNNSDNIYYSHVNEPWSLANSLRVGGEGSAEKITGLASYGGMVVVFKEKSIWTLDGLSEQTFFSRPVVKGIGCVSHHSIVQVDGLLYFWGKDGIYGFDGSLPKKISDPVQDVVMGRHYLRDHFIVGAEDEVNQSIIWSYPASMSNENNKQLVFFYGNSKMVQRPSWSPWDMGNINYIATVTTSNLSKLRKIWVGTDGGIIGEMDAGDIADISASPVFRWRTGKWDGKVPEYDKAWSAVSFELVPGTDTHIEVRYYRNSDTGHEFLDSISPTDATHHLRLSERARDLTLELYQAESQGVEVTSFTLTGAAAGRPR